MAKCGFLLLWLGGRITLNLSLSLVGSKERERGGIGRAISTEGEGKEVVGEGRESDILSR